MKLIFAAILFAAFVAIPLGSSAQEQQPGKPLYFPGGEYKEHPSDLAPDTDPEWQKYQQERDRKIKAGEKVEDPYDNPTESVYETETRYELVDKHKKKTKHHK